jgi:hypothetical protein
MNVTLKDVAESAGRFALGGLAHLHRWRIGFSQDAPEGGEGRARTRLHPNALASSLTTGRTKLIGLISNNFHNPIFLEVFDLFTRGLQDRGLRPLLVNLSDETDPANSVRMLRQYSVDGVMVASSTLPPDFAKAFRDAGMPVVHSFGRATRQPQGPCGRHRQCRMRAHGGARADRGAATATWPFLAGRSPPPRPRTASPALPWRACRHPGIRCATALRRPIPSMRGAMEMTKLFWMTAARAGNGAGLFLRR